MTAGISTTGFTAATIDEIVASIGAELQAKIDNTLDLSADQPFGQAVGIFAERESKLWQIIQTLANAINPDAAEDWLADFICALTGTTRKPAKKSSVILNCNVNNGFAAPAGQMMANVTGQPSIKFTNKAAVGPFSPAGVYPITFECTEYGPIPALATTLTTITAPVSGWNSCTNPLDATLGNLREQDADLMNRREQELTRAGACTVDSLRADLLEVKGVKQAFVFENTTLTTDVNGLPGKAIEPVIYDGLSPEALDADVAATVWKGKPSGSETHGSISTNTPDATGVTQTVHWSRATVENVYLDFSGVVVDPETFPANGADLIKAACVTYGQKKQNLGIDVVALGYKGAAMTVQGVLDVPLLKLGLAPSPAGTANIVVTGRQIASIDSSRITVTSVDGTP